MNPLKRSRKPGGGRPAADPGGLSFSLGTFDARTETRLRSWEECGYLRRLWARDPSLWAPCPAPEIQDRLGWLDLPEIMAPRLPGFEAFARDIAAEGFTRAVLLGMGGSSLAPEVFQKTFGNAPGRPELTVLDSTHPDAVAALERGLDLERTLFIVSSKSGTTVEPLSFFRYFWSRAARVAACPGKHFVAITDPGTPLAALARDRNFRRVFEAPPDVGGRFSALTEFGLVPAALIGLEAGRLLASAREEARANAAGVPARSAPGLMLGAALGEAAPARDKLTLLVSASLRSFPDWLEQLVAESTGKDGKGLVPVAGEPALPAGRYGGDRLFVSVVMDGDPSGRIDRLTASLERAGHPVIRIRLSEAYALGREVFRWEVAVAAAGSAIGIHPFNQPDVELAKMLAREAMSGRPEPGAALGSAAETFAVDDAEAVGRAFDAWLEQTRSGDYFAIQAYLAPDDATTRLLRGLRLALSKRTGLPTTLGYGPRFLHSTGQLHKGGPNEACVLQLVDEPASDLAVPETDFTFGGLIRAQALGDYQALRRRGRRALRVNLKDNPARGVESLTKLAEA